MWRLTTPVRRSSTIAGPSARPGDPAIPSSTISCSFTSLSPSSTAMLLGLPEARIDEVTERAHGFVGSIAGCFDVEVRPFRAAQEQDAHHALRVRRLPFPTHDDVGREFRGQLDELR